MIRSRASTATAIGVALASGLVASMALNPVALAVARVFRNGELGTVYARKTLFLMLPLGILWALTALLLIAGWSMVVGRKAPGATLVMALLHGAACGVLYVYFLAVAFFDPDDFIGSNQEATPWNYSLWSWELYPAFALSGALCGLVAWRVYGKSAHRQSEP